MTRTSILAQVLYSFSLKLFASPKQISCSSASVTKKMYQLGPDTNMDSW